MVGTQSNRDAVGARLRLRVGDQWQTRVVNAGSGYVSSHSKRQHFGLGSATSIDEVEIEWPSGERAYLRDLAIDRAYRITEGRPMDDATTHVKSDVKSNAKLDLKIDGTADAR